MLICFDLQKKNGKNLEVEQFSFVKPLQMDSKVYPLELIFHAAGKWL